VALRRQLTRPPIREALISILIAPEKPLDFAKQLAARWPNCRKKKVIHRGQIQLQLGESFSTSQSQELMGVRCDSDDGRSITQVRRDGITFSIIKDYSDWTELEAQTMGVWRTFLDLAGPVTVSNIATKFINILRMPTGNIEFDEYFTAAPRIPSALPQIMSEFFQKVTVPLKTDASAVIIQALDAPTTDAVSVILDIEVQLSCHVRSDGNDIHQLINSLRELKNTVFFSSVTEKALEAY
jgi:uncharacterized protein (TIGR04255 family)